MLLDKLEDRKIEVRSVGKIFDVFLGRGITAIMCKTKNNADGMNEDARSHAGPASAGWSSSIWSISISSTGIATTWKATRARSRNSTAGCREFRAALRPDDLAILTADHGCDPTTPSTDHSREYTPLLAFGPRVRPGVDLGLRATLSDIGQTVAENFATSIEKGTSFLSEITYENTTNGGQLEDVQDSRGDPGFLRRLPAAGGGRHRRATPPSVRRISIFRTRWPRQRARRSRSARRIWPRARKAR